MSRANTTNTTPFEGFSVMQSNLGAQLQFLPALGTPELDSLIDAFLPGPASMKDKRATVVMDFCEYAKRTGQNFKYYAVYQTAGAGAATSTDSPASSAAMYDSGYASSFNASPAVSDATTGFWNVFSPSTAAQTKQRSSPSSSSSQQRKSSAASSSQRAAAAAKDFSHLPGMKIMTKDGQDVTNSASRGCKTKEQRDHAHLMRIIKACDSCKRKKIRCDPSHKKRTASSQEKPSPAESRPSKKSRKVATSAAAAEVPAPAFNEFDAAAAAAAAAAGDASFHMAPTPAFPAEDLLFTDPFVEDSWESFIQFDEDISGLPFDYNFQLDGADNYFSPTSSSSGSSSLSPSSQQPFTPAPPGPSPVDVYSGSLFPEPDGLEEAAAQLPYLSSGLHGANYIDFNLFSPPANFLDDEEPLQLQTTKTSRRRRKPGTPGGAAAAIGAGQNYTDVSSAHNGLSDDHQSSVSPVAAIESYFCGCTEDQQQRRQSVAAPEPGWRVPGDRPGRYDEQASGGRHHVVDSAQSPRGADLQQHHYSLHSAYSHALATAATAATSQPGSPAGLAASAPTTSRLQQQQQQQYQSSGSSHNPIVSSSSCGPTLSTNTGSNIQTSVTDHHAVEYIRHSVATSQQAEGHQLPHDKGCGKDGLATTTASSPSSFSSPASSSSCFSPLLSSSSSSSLLSSATTTTTTTTPVSSSSLSPLQTVSPASPGASPHHNNAAAHLSQSSAADHRRRRAATRSSVDELGARSRGDGQPLLPPPATAAAAAAAAWLRDDQVRDHQRDSHNEDLPKRGSNRSIIARGGVAVSDLATRRSLASSTPEHYGVSREGKLHQQQSTAPSGSTVLRGSCSSRRHNNNNSSYTVFVSTPSSTTTSSSGNSAAFAVVSQSSHKSSSQTSTILPSSLPASAVGLGHNYYYSVQGVTSNNQGSSSPSSRPGEQQANSGDVVATAGLSASMMLLLTAALLLSTTTTTTTLPVRPLVDGLRSAPVAAVVLLGLVSLLLVASAFVISQSLLVPSGIVSDILFSKLPAAALALAPLGIRHHSSSESSSSSSSSSSPLAEQSALSVVVRETMNNIQFKVQRAAECVSDLRCVIARRLAGPMSLSRGSAVVGR